jgi:murein hydrolase activator
MRLKSRLILFFISIFICTEIFLQKELKEKLIQKKNSLEKEIETASKLLNETRSKSKNSFHELEILKVKIEKRSKLIDNINREIYQIDKEIEKNNELIESYKNELERVKNEYADLIYFAFKNRSSEFNFMYLLASKDLNIFYSRIKYLQQYKEYRKEQAKLIIALKKIIEKRIDELIIKKQDQKKLLNKKAFEKASLIKDSDDTDQVLKELKKQENSLLNDIEKKKKIYQKLEKEIEELIKSEAKKNNFNALSSDLKLVAKNFEDNKGRLPWPTAKGIIINKFGDHPHPVIKGVNVSNNGIDISTVKDADIKCIFKGKVSKIFNIKGANSTVIVQHGNYFTVYHNLINIYVKSGQDVNINERLGVVYTDPKNGESILHLEVWKELEKQDPEIWLSY